MEFIEKIIETVNKEYNKATTRLLISDIIDIYNGKYDKYSRRIDIEYL